MIQSKFKAFGIFRFILGICLLLFIILCIYVLLSVYFLNNPIIKRGTLKPYQALFFISFLTLLFSISIRSLLIYAVNINIDTNAKTIVFENIITRKTEEYSFSDFDSYLDTYAVTGKGGSYKVIYLLKDKRAEKIITGFYYSNIEELQEALQPIKYLGFQKDFSTLARKSLLNKPILRE